MGKWCKPYPLFDDEDQMSMPIYDKMIKKLVIKTTEIFVII